MDIYAMTEQKKLLKYFTDNFNDPTKSYIDFSSRSEDDTNRESITSLLDVLSQKRVPDPGRVIYIDFRGSNYLETELTESDYDKILQVVAATSWLRLCFGVYDISLDFIQAAMQKMSKDDQSLVIERVFMADFFNNFTLASSLLNYSSAAAGMRRRSRYQEPSPSELEHIAVLNIIDYLKNTYGDVPLIVKTHDLIFSLKVNSARLAESTRPNVLIISSKYVVIFATKHTPNDCLTLHKMVQQLAKAVKVWNKLGEVVRGENHHSLDESSLKQAYEDIKKFNLTVENVDRPVIIAIAGPLIYKATVRCVQDLIQLDRDGAGILKDLELLVVELKNGTCVSAEERLRFRHRSIEDSEDEDSDEESEFDFVKDY